MKRLMRTCYNKARRVASNVRGPITNTKRQFVQNHRIALRSINAHETILLAGGARSGTTWLGNIIAACRGFGLLFEPLHPQKVQEACELPLQYLHPEESYPQDETFMKQILKGELNARIYLHPQRDHPQYEAFIRRALSGKVHNAWTDCHDHRFLIWRYLVKTIRANLMLAWIDRNFLCPIVFTIRHPCATVLSRRKLWKAASSADMFLSQPALVENYLAPFEYIIRKIKTPIQKYTLMWCVENLVPLRQLADHDWIFCTYEELCRDTEGEVDRILTCLGLHRTKRVEQMISRAHLPRPDSAVNTGKDVVSDWQNHLSKEEIKEILDIVGEFGIELYGREPMPVDSCLQKLRRDR